MRFLAAVATGLFYVLSFLVSVWFAVALLGWWLADRLRLDVTRKAPGIREENGRGSD